MGSTLELACAVLLHVSVSVWPACRLMGASGLHGGREGGWGGRVGRARREVWSTEHEHGVSREGV